MSYLIPNDRETVTPVGSAWIICRSKSFTGRIYYFNTQTGEAVWDLSETEVEIAKRRTKILKSQPGFVIENCPEPPESPKDDPTPNKLPSRSSNQVPQHNLVPAKLYKKQVLNNCFPATTTLCTAHQYHVCNPMNPIQCNIPVAPVINPPMCNAAPQQNIFVTPTYRQPQPFTSNNNYDHVFLNNMSNTPSNSFTRLSGDGQANKKIQIRLNKYQHHPKSPKNCRVNKLKKISNQIDLRLVLSLKRRENQLKEKESQFRANAAVINNNKYKQGVLDPLSIRIQRESNYSADPNEEEDIVNDGDYEQLNFTHRDKKQDGPHPSRIRRRSYSFNENKEKNEKNYCLEHLANKNSGTSQGALSSLPACRRRSISCIANEGENDEDNDWLEQSNKRYIDTNQGDFSQQPSRVRRRSFCFSENQKEETNEANKWPQHLNNKNVNQSDVSPLSTHRKSVSFKLNEEDNDGNAWLEAKLKTQRDINSSERKASTSFSQIKENTDVTYIVPDSNVFLKNIILLDDILNTDKKCCLLVPKMVINKIQAATKSHCRALAYKALYFIWQQHEANLAVIEDGSEENESNDDDLLNFCCQLIDQEIHVVLLTDDTELINSNNSYNTNIRIITTVKMQKLVDEYKCNETTTTTTHIDTEALTNAKITIENKSNIQHNEEVIKSPMWKCMSYEKSFDENQAENNGADNVFQTDKRACDVGVQASCNFPSVSSLSNTDVEDDVLLPDSTKANGNVPCKDKRACDVGVQASCNFPSVSSLSNTDVEDDVLLPDSTKANGNVPCKDKRACDVGVQASCNFPSVSSLSNTDVEDDVLLPDSTKANGNVPCKDKRACDVGVQASCNFPSVSSLSNTDVEDDVLLHDSTKANGNVPCKTGGIKLKRNLSTDSKKNPLNESNTNLTSSLANDGTKAGNGAESTYPVTDSTVNETTLCNRKNFSWGLFSNKSTDSCNMNEGSDTSSIVLRNVNQRENITIEDSNSVISNTTSNVDTDSERGGVHEANTGTDDRAVMFEVSGSRMEEALRVKMDEWVSRLVQIMEEALSQLLEREATLALEPMPPPWTLHEAAECVRKHFRHDVDVLTAAERLLAVSTGLQGKIKPNISPHKYMELYSYGVYLIDALQGVFSSNEDLQTASEALSKLLNDIQQSYSDPGAQDSFTDISTQESDANVSADKDKSQVEANQGIEKQEVLKISPIGDNKKQSPASILSKYNLRSQRKNSQENRETSDVTFIRTIDPEFSFFSSLDLKKISSSNNQTVTEKPQQIIIGSGTSDNIQEKSPSLQNTNEHITSSGESTAPILNGDPKMNEPKVIRNFFKCVEFEEKLKHKTGLLDNQEWTYDDEDDTEEGGLLINEDFTDEYASNNLMDSDYYYPDYVENLWYDGHNPEENDLGSLENSEALNTNHGDKAVTFKLLMEGLESDILKVYTSIRDFCARSSESLQSEDLSADDTSRMLARAEKTRRYICKICDQLESILRRENTHKSIFQILRRKEFADFVVEDSDKEDYRDYIGNCLEQGNILKETVELVVRACKPKAA